MRIPGSGALRAGRGFSYRDADGALVDASTRAWIQGLAIPPAWTDVWISPDPDGHLLATGIDARGRKQYRYHAAYRRRRDDRKYERIAAFGAALPRLRRQVDADLRRHGLPREKVVAAVVALLDETSLRVGSERYARDNRSYGLTTLRSRHATAGSRSVRLRFKGKSGRQVDVGLQDRRLASVVSRCQDLPGQRLFQYEDPETGDWEPVMSDDVNDYIHAAIGDEFSAKDFRTWHGTLAAFEALARDERPAGQAPAGGRGGGGGRRGRRAARQHARGGAPGVRASRRSTGRSRRGGSRRARSRPGRGGGAPARRSCLRLLALTRGRRAPSARGCEAPDRRLQRDVGRNDTPPWHARSQAGPGPR